MWLALAGLAAPLAHAQIATDGTLGAATALVGPDFAIPASLGRQAGANLFHSFATFGVPTGGSATFSGPGTVGNIISRVTGGAGSSIDGTLRSTIAGANLFLINPRGIVFGPNASLDLTGAFHASTANYLRMADGTRFEATATVPAMLSIAAPEAFGFLGPTAAPITLQPGAQLVPPPGASVSLIGGPIDMTGAVVYTTSADARLVAAQGVGEVTLAGAFGAGIAGAPIAISGGGVVAESTTDAAPGRIVIRGGALTFSGGSMVSNNFSAVPAPPIEVLGSGDVTFSGGQLLSIAQGGGRGADIVARGENLRIDGAAWVQSTTLASGRAGDVDLEARARVSVVELASDPDRTVVVAQTQAGGDGGNLRLAGDLVRIDGAYVRNRTFAAGNSGVLAIEGRNIDVLNGASVAAETKVGSTGAGGGMRVRATERFRIAGANAFGDAAYVFASTDGAGEGGPISIQARDLVIRGGYLDTVTEGSGNGGAMTVDAETVTVDALGYFGGITSLSGAAATGRAGSITIRASRSIWVGGLGYGWQTGGGYGPSLIATQNVGAGEGGTVLVEAPRTTLDSGWIVAEGYGSGRVGSVTVRSDDLTLLRGALVRSTRAPGATGGSGSIRIEGGGTLTLGARDAATTKPTEAEGGSAGILTADAGDSPAGSISIDMPDVYIGPASYVSSKAVGAGDAGDIVIRAQRMNVRGGLIISQTGVGVPTDAPGRAGAITLDIAESLEMSNLGEVPTGNSGVLSSTTTGRGDAGDVRITAPSIVLDGFLVQAATLGAGRGGRVEIRAGDLTLRNGAQVSTGTEPGASGDAGAIDVHVAGRLELYGQRGDGIASGFTATTRGAGAGGSIALAADTIAMNDGAFVTASTVAQGDAGSIALGGRVLELLDGRVSTATTAEGRAGAITIAMSERATLAGRISSETDGGGRGGDVAIAAPDVDMQGGIVTRTDGAADGGAVEVRGARLRLTGAIDASTIGGGAAGGITLAATERIDISGGGVQAETAGLAGGAGGNVRIEAPVVTIEDFALVSTRTALAGPAGAIDIAGGDVTVRSLAEVKSGSLGAGNAGPIRIRATRSILVEDAYLNSSTSGDGRGGDITLEAPSVVIGVFGSVSALSTPFFGIEGTGDGGNIYLRGDQVIVDGTVDASTYMAGRAGNIDIRGGQLTVLTDPSDWSAFGEILSETWAGGAAGSVHIDMTRGVLVRGSILTRSNDTATGAGGAVYIRAPEVRMEGGGVGASTWSAAPAGRIVVEADRFAAVDRGGVDSSTFGAGDAGSVEVRARNVTLADRGELTTSSAYGATGHAGRIAVAAESLVASAGRIDSSTASSGDAGAIEIRTGTLQLDGGAVVASSSEAGAPGNAGRIDIAAGSAVLLAGEGTQIATRTGGSGSGGEIRVAAPLVSVVDGAAILATTAAEGAAGRIAVAADRLVMMGGSVDSSTAAGGPAGEIVIGARTVDLAGAASVASSSGAAATGDAGRVTVAAGESVSLAGAGTEIATRTAASGAGGAIRIEAPRVSITDGALVTATSTGSGTAGSVEIVAPDALRLFGGTVSTEALASDGGDITVLAGNRVHLRAGEISTSVGSGAGAGGNIFIDPTFVILEDGSRIVANAFGGPGGNITLIADYFFASIDSLVQASSALGVPGTVSILAPLTDPNASLVKLSTATVDASALLREGCATRYAGARGASSLVDVGRGGLAASPERMTASRYFGPVAAPYVHGHRGQRAPAVAAAGRAGLGGCAG